MKIKTLLSLLSVVILTTLSTSVFAVNVFFVNKTGGQIMYKFVSRTIQVPPSNEFILQPNETKSIGKIPNLGKLSIRDMGQWSRGYYDVDTTTPFNKIKKQIALNPADNLFYVIYYSYAYGYYLEPQWQLSEEGWEVIG